MLAVTVRGPLGGWVGNRMARPVGRLVEVISGQPLGKFLQDRMFGPLGMTDTGFGVAAAKVSRLAAMYGHPDLCAQDQTLLKIFSPGSMGVYARHDVSDTYPTDIPGTGIAMGGAEAARRSLLGYQRTEESAADIAALRYLGPFLRA